MDNRMLLNVRSNEFVRLFHFSGTPKTNIFNCQHCILHPTTSLNVYILILITTALNCQFAKRSTPHGSHVHVPMTSDAINHSRKQTIKHSRFSLLRSSSGVAVKLKDIGLTYIPESQSENCFTFLSYAFYQLHHAALRPAITATMWLCRSFLDHRHSQ